MDAQQPITLEQGLEWLKQGTVAVFALFGVGGIGFWLVKYFVTRRGERKDRLDETQTTNEGKRIDLDTAAFEATDKRLLRLEQKFDDLQAEHSRIMADNAGLQKENEFLKRDNVRMAEELEKNRERIRYLEDEVTALTVRINMLTNWQNASDEKDRDETNK